MSAGDFVSRNAKAVVSGLGGVITVGTAAAGLFQYAPASIAGAATGLLTAFEVMRTFNVWLVKNEPLIEAAADAGEQLVESVKAAVEPRKPAPAVVPVAAPAVAAASVAAAVS